MLAYAVFLRGGIILLPIALLLLILSDNRLQTLTIGAEAVSLLVLGSMAGGLFYGVAGRHVRHIPIIGWFLAGMIGIFPYILVLEPLTWLIDDRPLLSPARHVWQWPGTMDWGWVWFATVVFGSAVGYGLRAASRSRKAAGIDGE